MSWLKLVSASLLASVLAACGGSSGGGAETTRTAGLRLGASAPIAPPTATAHALMVQSLYLAYFGRAPDNGGFAFWNNSFETLNLPTTAAGLISDYNNNGWAKSVVDGFMSGPEAQALNSGSNADFVNTVYMNLFGRYAEVGGVAYWAGRLDRNEITRPVMVLEIMGGAQADDQLAMSKKNEIVTRYLAQLAAAGIRNDVPLSVVGHDLPALVNKDTDLAAFQTSIDAAVQTQRSETAPTYTLRYTDYQENYSALSTNVLYRYSSGSGVVPVFGGKLTFGLGEREIGFSQLPNQTGAVIYGAPVSSSFAISDNADGRMPIILMLCQIPSGTTQARSTDVLVLKTATLLRDPSELAGQTFAFHRQDCAAQNDNLMTFNATGAVHMTRPGEDYQAFASQVKQGLNTKTFGMGASEWSLRAYRYSKGDGAVKYAIVLKETLIDPASGKPTGAGAVSLWSQE
ncbi:DUF4214 domain-containing protein [Duganella sp. BJB1802]|uniref:DUF4214 domain-containing protein n=1 Tax=Duganella sp. BJB1802 TaxID=2744575 RepID=UPI00159339AD|nr:DUF4214 domain-containing protein [Duganella sp. BJB1802]NVD70429.1 DUF4214 domain-containing protein [Duganella sp. BJB1802]